MQRFVAKSPEVEADRITAVGEERLEWELNRMVAWITSRGGKAAHNGSCAYVTTEAGVAMALPGDWVVRNADGTFYVTSDRSFRNAYVAAPADATPEIHEMDVSLRYGVNQVKVAQFLPPNGHDAEYASRFAAWIKPHSFDVKHSRAGDALYVSTMRGPAELRYGWWLVKLTASLCVVESPEEFAANYDMIATLSGVVKVLEKGVSRDTALTAAQFSPPDVGGEQYAAVFLSWVMSGGGDAKMDSSSGFYSLRVVTVHGLVDLNQNDWVVRLGAGRYVVHQPANFARFYTVVQ